jgi:hypothetical protein
MAVPLRRRRGVGNAEATFDRSFGYFARLVQEGKI